MKSLVLIGLLLSSTVALAENGADDSKKDKNDPNRVVCIKETEVGSRLVARRVCKTAQQWKEERAQARSELQRAQNTQLNPQGH